MKTMFAMMTLIPALVAGNVSAVPVWECTNDFTAVRVETPTNGMVDSREWTYQTGETVTITGTFCELVSDEGVVREVELDFEVETIGHLWDYYIYAEVLEPLDPAWTPVYYFAAPVAEGFTKILKVYDGTTLRADGTERVAYKFELTRPDGSNWRIEVAY